LPLLEQRFPAYRDTLTRGARHFAEASELLDELAQQDAQGWRVLQRLNYPSCANYPIPAQKLAPLLAAQAGRAMPQNVQLDEILKQLLGAREDAAISVNFSHWQVLRYQDKAYAMQDFGAFDQSLVLPWHGEAELEWPALNSRLIFRHTQEGHQSGQVQSAPVPCACATAGSLAPACNCRNTQPEELIAGTPCPTLATRAAAATVLREELVSVVGWRSPPDFKLPIPSRLGRGTGFLTATGQAKPARIAPSEFSDF